MSNMLDLSGKKYTLADRVGRHRFGGEQLQGAVATFLVSDNGKFEDYVPDTHDQEIVIAIAEDVGIKLH